MPIHGLFKIWPVWSKKRRWAWRSIHNPAQTSRDMNRMCLSSQKLMLLSCVFLICEAIPWKGLSCRINKQTHQIHMPGYLWCHSCLVANPNHFWPICYKGCVIVDAARPSKRSRPQHLIVVLNGLTGPNASVHDVAIDWFRDTNP